MDIVKLCFAFFLGGFVFGVFIVALLAWLNEIKEQKELEKQLKELGVKTHD